jgi:APA family basic amino acid/polyamine antiporter
MLLFQQNFIYLSFPEGVVNIYYVLKTFMLFAGLPGVLLTAILYVFSHDWSWGNFTPFFQTGLQGGSMYGWFIGAALIITPYFGFETVPQMVEEGTFPIKDQSKAILG